MASSELGAERPSHAAWRRYLRRWASAGVLGCLALTYTLDPGPAWSAPPVGPRLAARSQQEDAIGDIPLDKLTVDARNRLEGVVYKPSIFRRLPAKTILCDPDMYLFLIRYPEVVVNIWELMGVTNIKLERTGDFTFECSDGAGTVGTVELVYGTHNLHVLYAEATYEGPLSVRKLKGRGVLILKSQYKEDVDKQVLVENELDVFIQLDQAGAELIAKTLQPVVGKTADINFHESAMFVSRVSEAAENNGPGMQRLAAKLKNVSPEVRQQFGQVALVVAERAAQRTAAVAPAPAAHPPVAQVPATSPAPQSRMRTQMRR